MKIQYFLIAFALVATSDPQIQVFKKDVHCSLVHLLTEIVKVIFPDERKSDAGPSYAVGMYSADTDGRSPRNHVLIPFRKSIYFPAVDPAVLRSSQSRKVLYKAPLKHEIYYYQVAMRTDKGEEYECSIPVNHRPLPSAKV